MTILPRTEADYVKAPEVLYDIQLSEKEIRRVGERRYSRSHWKLQVGVVLGPSLAVLIWGLSIKSPVSDITLRAYGYAFLFCLVEGLAAI